MTISEKVSSLRAEMEKRNIDIYIITSSDAHQSEYTPDYYKGREWISGFTGSAGVAVITKDRALLFTDSRYFIQGKDQLQDGPFELMKQGVDYKDYIEFLSDVPQKQLVICIDGKTVTVEAIDRLNKLLSDKDVELKYSEGILKNIWADRPSIPSEPVHELPDTYAGESRESKLSRIRETMKAQGAQFHIITTLDDIAWVFNIRGSDVEMNPVALAYAIISEEKAELFIGEERLSPVLADRINSDKVELKSYFDFDERLSQFESGAKILVDKSTLSYTTSQNLKHTHLIYDKLPSRYFKAIKNSTEVSHIKRAMVKDGHALTKTFMWIEKTIQERTIKETEIVDKLIHFRSQQDNYKGESFDAIVGYNGNGAIVHYRAQKSSAADIENSGYLLIDSGGQYMDGTTDITRTISFGDPSQQFKEHYTLVLKGHIGLAITQFPDKTRGVQLDIKAREHLWNHGLDYGHGTGHGVGFFLNVHEPPQGITQNIDLRGRTQMKAGMFSSNEPGYYLEGQYGIRIENLILNIPHEKHEGFLKFDTLTVFPISTKNIDISMMTEEEINWLNGYHDYVREQLSPGLEPHEIEWLEEKCRPI